MFDHDAAQFTAPIPGQSLTTEPQGRPWETPAKYSDPVLIQLLLYLHHYLI